jgi:SAM-dependent methyltransferase
VCTSPVPAPGIVDPSRDGHSDIFYSAYSLFKARWIQKIKPVGRLMEVGCGEGYFLDAAKSIGYEVTGIEAHPERAARTAQRVRAKVFCGLLESTDTGNSRFDVVYHCDLLSHFPDPASSLRKMGRFLAPNGILAFEAGTLGGIHPFWYRLIGGLGFPQHRWLYSEGSLRKLLEMAGLTVIKMHRFGLAPAVALHYSHSAAGKAFRRICPQTFRHSRRGEVSTPNRRGQKGDWSESVEQFFRYRVGRFAPQIGPATWLIAAQPNRESLS